jgi:hypothetical protein
MLFISLEARYLRESKPLALFDHGIEVKFSPQKYPASRYVGCQKLYDECKGTIKLNPDIYLALDVLFLIDASE